LRGAMGTGAMSEKQLPAESSSETPCAENWRRLWWLPCQFSVEVSLPHFTVGELLRLQPGRVVASCWSRSAEVPVYANKQRIGWAEFDEVNGHIGARITQLV